MAYDEASDERPRNASMRTLVKEFGWLLRQQQSHHRADNSEQDKRTGADNREQDRRSGTDDSEQDKRTEAGPACRVHMRAASSEQRAGRWQARQKVHVGGAHGIGSARPLRAAGLPPLCRAKRGHPCQLCFSSLGAPPIVHFSWRASPANRRSTPVVRANSCSLQRPDHDGRQNSCTSPFTFKGPPCDSTGQESASTTQYTCPRCPVPAARSGPLPATLPPEHLCPRIIAC
ncbi:hypothetical protein PMIN01_01232 [Paraphaeosphaeria minitans]|uniref:Uncharacterized protein n=1 Tax=Paraphaeosphaeria minitans TaxID=565426 RepID=A0A9P6GUC3_9PLEO|nr:hypothetical protein PMIN01_01232 [Paraphaeosphaeria minitans]